jgi:hypothetical protein
MSMMAPILDSRCRTGLTEGAGDCLAYGLGDRRREGVPDLSVGGCLAARKVPGVREPLQPGDHPGCQLRYPGRWELRAGAFISDAKPVDTQFAPGRAGAGRAEVRAPCFLLPPTIVGALPAARRTQS